MANLETRISRLELAIFGNPELRMAGIQDKLDKLEEHAEAQTEHNRKQEAATQRQRWMAAGVLVGLAAQGVGLITLLRIAAQITTGTP